MTDKLMCPFCKREMTKVGNSIFCLNADCISKFNIMPIDMYVAISTLQKKLDKAMDTLVMIRGGYDAHGPTDTETMRRLVFAIQEFADTSIKEIEDIKEV